MVPFTKRLLAAGVPGKNTLIRASPLMLTALCTALPARLGLVVIGNEGALVMGGLSAVLVGLSLGTTIPGVGVQGAMALGSIIGGGVWIAIVGALRHYRGVNETISSLLMNYIAIAFMNHLVQGPLRDPEFVTKTVQRRTGRVLFGWAPSLPPASTMA